MIIIMLFVMSDCTSIVYRKYIGLIQDMYLECEILVPSTSGESSTFMATPGISTKPILIHNGNGRI